MRVWALIRIGQILSASLFWRY